MKKKYITPAIEMVALESEELLNVVSQSVFSGTTVGSKDVLSREIDFDDALELE
jgi:hypothetical protein